MPVKIIPTPKTAAVDALLARATTADGIPPISDGLLDAAPRALTLGAYAHDTLIGWAVAAWQGTRGAAELVVDPDRRGRGAGAELLAAVRETLAGHPGPGTAALDTAALETANPTTPFPPLNQTWFWSHGDHPAAVHMAQLLGYRRERELLQLHTDDLAQPDDLPEPVVPEGIELRTYQPGDEADWLRVNNAAFDWHPEQGGQTPQDYRDMIDAPDFNPADVIFAVDATSGALIGFHETKLHPDHPSGKLVGEVYVIGVDPAVHAHGVGRALTVAGMRHMLDQGAQMIELYVESDNVPALRLYESLGFSHRIVHVSYAPPANDAPPATDAAATTQTDTPDSAGKAS